MAESHISPRDDSVGFEKEKEIIRLRGEVIRMQSVIATLLENEERRTAREHEHRRRLTELEKLVTKDQKTGLLNRMGFDEVMDAYLASMARAEHRHGGDGERATFVYIDFDRFKPINDLFSHRVGDVMLMKVGSVFKRTLRPNDCIARLGGDEFGILLRGVSDRKTAEHVVEKLRTALRTVTIDNADPEQLETFYEAVGRRHALDFSAGYHVIVNTQLSVHQIEDLAEEDVPKLAILRPRRGEYEPQERRLPM